jgi:hypothetical protein
MQHDTNNMDDRQEDFIIYTSKSIVYMLAVSYLCVCSLHVFSSQVKKCGREAHTTRTGIQRSQHRLIFVVVGGARNRR